MYRAAAKIERGPTHWYAGGYVKTETACEAANPQPTGLTLVIQRQIWAVEVNMALADFMRAQFPLEGIRIDDLNAALAVLASSPQVGEARILRIEPRHDGHLLVQTGHLAGPLKGGGKYFLLKRIETGWTIVETNSWRS